MTTLLENTEISKWRLSLSSVCCYSGEADKEKERAPMSDRRGTLFFCGQILEILRVFKCNIV